MFLDFALVSAKEKVLAVVGYADGGCVLWYRIQIRFGGLRRGQTELLRGELGY